MFNFNTFFNTKLDFTYPKYIQLCETIIDSGLTIITLKDYFSNKELLDRFVIIRHDIDDEIDLKYALKMAKTEHDLGFKTTYYFRYNEKVFNIPNIQEISSLGHEIGYHYEVLGKADGDYETAIKLFENELEKFRNVCEIKTIAQHGGPLKSGLNVINFSNILEIIKQMLEGKKIFDNWKSKELWNRYDFKNYGIIGEPYLSLNFNEILYLSDTNTSWIDTNYRLKDKIDSDKMHRKYNIRSTDDIIKELKTGKLQKVHILTHPSNWKEKFFEWIKWSMLQQIRNTGKKIIVFFSNSKPDDRNKSLS